MRPDPSCRSLGSVQLPPLGYKAAPSPSRPASDGQAQARFGDCSARWPVAARSRQGLTTASREALTQRLSGSGGVGRQRLQQLGGVCVAAVAHQFPDDRAKVHLRWRRMRHLRACAFMFAAAPDGSGHAAARSSTAHQPRCRAPSPRRCRPARAPDNTHRHSHTHVCDAPKLALARTWASKRGKTAHSAGTSKSDADGTSAHT